MTDEDFAAVPILGDLPCGDLDQVVQGDDHPWTDDKDLTELGGGLAAVNIPQRSNSFVGPLRRFIESSGNPIF